MNKDRYSHISDQELLEKYEHTGDSVWLGLLLQRYTLLVFGVCMKYLKNEAEAQDCVQQIYLKVIGELGKYKVDYFKSWLYMVAKNHCLSQLKSKKGKYYEGVDDRINNQIAENPEQGHRAEEVPVEWLQEGLESLNDGQQRCVTLFYLEKKSYQQICDVTGYNLLQVKSHIQNGKRNLKIYIEKKMKERDQSHGR